MNTAIAPRVITAPAVQSKDKVRDRYEIKTLADCCYRVYDHQEKCWVGNATEDMGTARLIIRKQNR